MQAEDRKDFETLIAELFGAIDKPLGESKINGFWKGLIKMSMGDFTRATTLLMSELDEREPPKNFSVHDIWTAKKRLRAAGPSPTQPTVPKWEGDDWDISANMHFWAHVTRRVVGHRPPYTAHQTLALCAAKKRWAEEMRAENRGGPVDVETQQARWVFHLGAAGADFLTEGVSNAIRQQISPAAPPDLAGAWSDTPGTGGQQPPEEPPTREPDWFDVPKPGADPGADEHL